eukprot:m.344447 g.344447  ORF g.344447 m.344447 type:complete len:166 (-) comp24477_c0_seq1:3352-3849(-)
MITQLPIVTFIWIFLLLSANAELYKGNCKMQSDVYSSYLRSKEYCKTDSKNYYGKLIKTTHDIDQWFALNKSAPRWNAAWTNEQPLASQPPGPTPGGWCGAYFYANLADFETSSYTGPKGLIATHMVNLYNVHLSGKHEVFCCMLTYIRYYSLSWQLSILGAIFT